MIKTPCEIILWNFLPSLRRELVKAMIKNGLERKEIAEIFDITEAAICHYLKSKRGTSFRFGKDIQKRIEKIAFEVAKSKNREELIFETCRICAMLRTKKAFCKLHQRENPFLSKCGLYKGICLKS